MSNWNADDALKSGKAKTRDGRNVANLREITIDGRTCLIGLVCDTPRNKMKKGNAYAMHTRVWGSRGGLCCGYDDLMNVKEPDND